MRPSLAAGLLAAPSVQAFSDSSPFVLFSTARLAVPPKQDQLQTSSRVLSSVQELLSSCPTNQYLLVSQPNIHARDLRGPSGCRSPNLCRALENGKTQSRFDIAEVMGSLSFGDFSDYIRASCMAQGRRATVEEHQLRSLPSSGVGAKRAEVLADNDHELGQLLQKAQEDGDYTAIYFSNPNESKLYKAEFTDPVHIELRREIESRVIERRRANVSANASLFERYQFFTPGIFMGFVAGFIMLSILYVGLSALSSLEVSYGAFDKEMGPAAQKKQQ